jgi:hypothetical protein
MKFERLVENFLKKKKFLSKIADNGFYVDLENDTFLHFTTVKRSESIIEHKKLFLNVDFLNIKKFGTDTNDAISLLYGDFVPKVQTTHLKVSDDDIVGIKFKTNNKPYIGYVEEVKWEEDVDLISPEIISLTESINILKNTPEKIKSDQYVIYENKTTSDER